jgi:hypothetical protein
MATINYNSFTGLRDSEICILINVVRMTGYGNLDRALNRTTANFLPGISLCFYSFFSSDLSLPSIDANDDNEVVSCLPNLST